MDRRKFLRGAGTLIALPTLPSLNFRLFANSEPPKPKPRFVAVHIPLGMMPAYFFPKRDAMTTTPVVAEPDSPYLKQLAGLRGHFTAFGGLSHPGVGGGHMAGLSFLTGAPGWGPGFRNTQSLDQFVAERIGRDTRFTSFALGVQKYDTSDSSLAVSISKAGVPIPTEQSPRALYRRLFVAGTPAEQEKAFARIDAGLSALDLTGGSLKSMRRSIAAEDRVRLDQYTDSVRELELDLQRTRQWESKAKPTVDFPEPTDISDHNRVIEKSRLMFNLIRLALLTDSTRVVSMHISTFNTIAHVPGVKTDTHGLSHHCQEPEKIDELRKVEEAQMRTLGEFLESLRTTNDTEGSLLDHTQVLYGSCLGNANSHSNSNLPIILAGGGHRHLGFLGFDERANAPLTNLFVTMLQRMGIEVDAFSTGRSTLSGFNS